MQNLSKKLRTERGVLYAIVDGKAVDIGKLSELRKSINSMELKRKEHEEWMENQSINKHVIPLLDDLDVSLWSVKEESAVTSFRARKLEIGTFLRVNDNHTYELPNARSILDKIKEEKDKRERKKRIVNFIKTPVFWFRRVLNKVKK